MTRRGSRVRVFVEALSPDVRSLADAMDLESVLDAWVAEGREAWPDVALPDEDFLTHVARRLEPGMDLASLPAADLYLACACALGLPSAHAALERHVLPGVAPAVARVRGGGVDAAEVLQQLRQRLLVPEGAGRLPRIAEYQGAGPLAGWLRAAAVRTALNLQRSEGRRARVEEDAEVGGLTGGGLDVELDYLRQRHREDFRAALSDALAALSSRERTVLRLHVVEGLSLERIGAMYQTHKSTVSRWVAHARERVLVGARERLAERLQLSSDELHSLMRAVRSQLDLSLPAMLREPG
ncbi:sigma-70 family RNA polymerase sigma factor [Myxococcus stipitatus]|uniref:sigma-70 family RNA polymerase sigma factor n=1 Tax=Myxococcus stipitatus TaxID=83455 RepID=UPI001F3137C7|nr:sigma-70 family RNA polymerase sigma factor [Myxococcus stipitatus]MCE9668521.1 sigma-70 family RNA polymerase sigma factor [Myxococcus stipitatus]